MNRLVKKNRIGQSRLIGGERLARLRNDARAEGRPQVGHVRVRRLWGLWCGLRAGLGRGRGAGLRWGLAGEGQKKNPAILCRVQGLQLAELLADRLADRRV